MSSGHGCTEGKDYPMFHTITQLAKGSTSRIFQSCLEKINFGPPVKSNRYFFKLPRRMSHRTIFAESVQKGCSNDFSFERYGRQGNRKIENRAVVKVHLRCEKNTRKHKLPKQRLQTSLTCLNIHLFKHFGFLVRVLPYEIGDFREISGKIHLFKRLNK